MEFLQSFLKRHFTWKTLGAVAKFPRSDFWIMLIFMFLLNEMNPRKGWNGNRGQKISGKLPKTGQKVSGKLPTYPSPKPSFCPKWEVSVNVSLGEGVGGQFPKNLNWSDFCTLMYEGSSIFSWYSIVDVILGRTYPLDCSQRISNLTFLLMNLLH